MTRMINLEFERKSWIVDTDQGVTPIKFRELSHSAEYMCMSQVSKNEHRGTFLFKEYGEKSCQQSKSWRSRRTVRRALCYGSQERTEFM